MFVGMFVGELAAQLSAASAMKRYIPYCHGCAYQPFDLVGCKAFTCFTPAVAMLVTSAVKQQLDEGRRH
jgi:hypothetical protein